MRRAPALRALRDVAEKARVTGERRTVLKALNQGCIMESHPSQIHLVKIRQAMRREVGCRGVSGPHSGGRLNLACVVYDRTGMKSPARKRPKRKDIALGESASLFKLKGR
jgi:hypothetical protein